MDPQKKVEKKFDYKNYKRIEKRSYCPTKEVDPEHFIEPDLACFLYLFPKTFKKNIRRFIEVYNCVHCNACKSSNARYYLKNYLNKKGFQSEVTELMRDSFQKYGTPFSQNYYRFDIPEEVPEESDTLLFMGCLSYIKVPKYTLNAINYLLSKNIDFTILDKELCCGIPALDSGDINTVQSLMEKNNEILNGYKKIICVCPACYDIFINHYEGLKPEVHFIAEYFEPLKNKRNETLSIQHLCQLEYRGASRIIKKVKQIFRESGFKLMEEEKLWCCGGGMGIMHIEENIERISRIRVNDFKGEILTTYCPSCFHILKLFGRKEKIKPTLIDTFELFTE
jgi:Fe-S oxidoreductase